jgi:hypothetical protein
VPLRDCFEKTSRALSLETCILLTTRKTLIEVNPARTKYSDMTGKTELISEHHAGSRIEAARK